MRIHPNKAGKSFMCEICDKGFPSNGSLRAHLKLHSLSRQTSSDKKVTKSGLESAKKSEGMAHNTHSMTVKYIDTIMVTISRLYFSS